MPRLSVEGSTTVRRGQALYHRAFSRPMIRMMVNRSKPPPRSAAGAATRRGSVRIIGGRWKRTVLHIVDAPGLRPTPDRVREALFNWLGHALGSDLRECVVLDLFAGSGALGFEAASRGASRVMLVDNNTAAVQQLMRVQQRLSAADVVEVRRAEALVAGSALQESGMRFDLIFLDPPFGVGWLDNALPLAAKLCKRAGFIYVEAERSLDPMIVATLGLEIYRHDSAGEVFYHLLRCNKKEE